MRTQRFLALVCLVLQLASAHTIIPELYSLKKHRARKLPLQNHVVHQFPMPTWLENLATRDNGELLTTVLTSPDLFAVMPGRASSSRHLHTFPGVTGLLGITEVFPDVFVVVAGNFSLQTITSTPGSYSTWLVDFSRSTARPQTDTPKIKKVVDLPEASFLNGIAKLPSENGAVLIADSGLGVVWKLNVKTKSYETIIKGLEEMAPTKAVPIGINGIAVTKNAKFMYWTNIGTSSLYRAPILPSGALLDATIETLATDAAPIDDFALDESRGLVWVAGLFRNTIFAVDVRLGGKSMKTDVVGKISDLTVAGCTAVAFGKGKQGHGIIYVSTNGGMTSPVNGTLVEGGKIVAIDTRSFLR